MLFGIYAGSDPFSTGYDLLVASILCFDQLQDYIISLFASSEPMQSGSMNARRVARSNLNWTGDKVALVELSYAIYESGYCDDGEATVLDIIKQFELSFNVSLKSHARTWLAIRRRKSDKPSFMEKLLQAFRRQVEKSFRKNL
jgi:hypothetical protein